MDTKDTTTGFQALHTPMGLLVLFFAFMMFIAIIGAGSAFFKAAQTKDREVREKLRADSEHNQDLPGSESS